jgi:hypothetical protein
MIKGLQPISENFPHNLEIADHLVCIQLIGLKHQLDLAAVPVREAALVRMLAEHVAILHFK